jgi:hypothetical protein
MLFITFSLNTIFKIQKYLGLIFHNNSQACANMVLPKLTLTLFLDPYVDNIHHLEAPQQRHYFLRLVTTSQKKTTQLRAKPAKNT